MAEKGVDRLVIGGGKAGSSPALAGALGDHVSRITERTIRSAACACDSVVRCRWREAGKAPFPPGPTARQNGCMEGLPARRRVGATMLAWAMVIGVDFVLHAGVLAWAWREPSPFLLPPEELFVRIPLGYAAYLAQAILVVWLTARLGPSTARAGAALGMRLGLLFAIFLALALASATTISATMTYVWAVSTLAGFVAAGAVAAPALHAPRLRPLALRVAGTTLALVVFGVVAQNLIPAS